MFVELVCCWTYPFFFGKAWIYAMLFVSEEGCAKFECQ